MRFMTFYRFASLATTAFLLAMSAICKTQETSSRPEHALSGTQSAARRKEAFERHFLSKHPEPQGNLDGAVPGWTVLEGRARRNDALRERIRATSGAHPGSTSPVDTIFPGIALRPTLPAGSIPQSVATGDFNKDGHMDFVVANGDTSDLWIYFGKGDGTFERPQIIPLSSGLSPIYVTAADLRNNGMLDLIVAEFDTSTIGVLLNNGDGTYGYERQIHLPQPPTAIVVDDFNHDGKLDLAAVMYTLEIYGGSSPLSYIATMLGDGAGGFAAPVITLSDNFFSTASSIASADVNGDGLPDLLITGLGLENSQVFFNAGNGKFKPGPIIQQNGPGTFLFDGKLVDVNEDGCPDALVTDEVGVVWISLGDCKGNFSPPKWVPTGDAPSVLQVADVNGDGHPDLVTVSVPAGDPLNDLSGISLTVDLGDGHGNFSPGRVYPGSGESFSLAVADFNADGKPDFVCTNLVDDSATIYLNDGKGGFGLPEGFYAGIRDGPVDSPGDSVNFVDLNGDGKPDASFIGEGDNNELFVISLLNAGASQFKEPIASDLGINAVDSLIEDLRFADVRTAGHVDLLGIGTDPGFSGEGQFIAFAPGDGNGAFGKAKVTPVAGASGIMAVGDFNRDGKLDFAALDGIGGSNTLTVFLGNGDGTFRAGAVQHFTDQSQYPGLLYAADLNRDGKLDLIAYTTGNGGDPAFGNVWEFTGNGDGTFQSGKHLYSSFSQLKLLDINHDGTPNIVEYNWHGLTKFSNYLGQGNSNFKEVSSYASYSKWPEPMPPLTQRGDPAVTSYLADIDGDGKLDELAWQYVNQEGLPRYVQILKGNGDGTFEPTYDEFPFHAYGYPKYSFDLNGDGNAELVELVTGTSALHVYKSAPAPALQIALEQEQVKGSSGCGWVFPNVPSNSARTADLSSSVEGVLLPSSVTIAAGALQQRFCFTLGGTYDWHQVFDINAKLGTDTATAYASQVYDFGFDESLSSTADQDVLAGTNSKPVTVTLTAAKGYSTTVKLHCEGLPAGVNCIFGSASLDLQSGSAASTTIVISVPANAIDVQYPVTVVAEDGNITRRQGFLVVAVAFLISPSSYTFPTASPGTASSSFTFSGFPPFTTKCVGLPSGAACSFAVKGASYPAVTTMTVEVTALADLSAREYPFKIEVTSGATSATVNATLSISDFALKFPRASANWGVPGGGPTIAANATGINFTGQINVTCSLDVGGQCSAGEYSVTSGSNVVYLDLEIPSNASLGTHHLVVTAKAVGFPLTHSYDLPFMIGNYNGSLGNSSVTMGSDQMVSIPATVKSTTGFDDIVDLSCNAPTVLTCIIDPSNVQLTGASSKSVKVVIWSYGVGSGTTTYTLPVSATAQGTFTTRNLGTISVTLSQ
jgi:hypothetical protein